MKNLKLLICFFLFAGTALAQAGHGYRAGHHLLTSGNITADKNFYLLTVIGRSKPIQSILAHDRQLAGIALKQRAFALKHAADTVKSMAALLTDLRWTKPDSIQVALAIQQCYKANKAVFDKMLNDEIRPSGYYERFTRSDNAGLLVSAWGQYMIGVNYIIDQYGLGKKMRYPAIDSVSFDVKSARYQAIVKNILRTAVSQKNANTLFYQTSFNIAMGLMAANKRDEPARFEPMELGENKAAAQRVKMISWDKYTYSAIMVPGAGPETLADAISLAGKTRCDLAVERYQKGLAPFIIVSGGYVHPFQTPYCEAIEMKKYLISHHNIPQDAIIIEPQARHTTTNFRNAERLMIRYGIPVTKPALCVTTKDQADYIDAANFDKRNLKEIGYLPYRDKKHLDDNASVFFPVLESLTADSHDPIDP